MNQSRCQDRKLTSHRGTFAHSETVFLLNCVHYRSQTFPLTLYHCVASIEADLSARTCRWPLEGVAAAAAAGCLYTHGRLLQRANLFDVSGGGRFKLERNDVICGSFSSLNGTGYCGETGYMFGSGPSPPIIALAPALSNYVKWQTRAVSEPRR